jgi:glutathione synthase/RimK-type ligase-like ATP-grasp enzyme
MLLILTSDKDLAADFLIVELLKRGLPYFRLNAEELASADYTFFIDEEGIRRELTLAPKAVRLDQVDAVWYRRALQPSPAATLPAGERAFVAGELRHLATGIVLDPRAIWVNPIDKVFLAEHKLYQLRIAHRIGFKVPRTIISRDVEKLRRFVSANRAGTICKPIFHGLFFDGTDRYSVYTRRVEPDSFVAEQVTLCPVLLQEEIPRLSDVRATFIGPRCYVADIVSEEPIVDWREPTGAIRYSVSELPKNVEAMCRTMLAELCLLYGAFDFIRTPDGELVFLEVNATGEWAWLEDRLGFAMRDAFVRLFYRERNAL